MTESGPVLRGRRVLVVEDESFIAMMIVDALAELGAEVIGPASRIADAVALAEAADCDLALLDVNIAGQYTFALATRLQARGVPCLFVTGYGPEALPEELRQVPILGKPLRDRDLARLAVAAIGGNAAA
jgi:CheY-like chemotaxis protein